MKAAELASGSGDGRGKIAIALNDQRSKRARAWLRKLSANIKLRGRDVSRLLQLCGTMQQIVAYKLKMVMVLSINGDRLGRF